MTIIATCGHTLTNEEGLGTTIAVKGYENGEHIISYPTVCDKCLKWYEKRHLILKTKKQQKQWLN
jgi:hypothetical protein